MSFSFLIFFLILSLSSGQTYFGPTWQNQTALQKDKVLHQVITSNTKPGSFPSTLELAELFLESMQTSFDYVGDDMPSQFPSRRPKLIHSVGVIIDSKWVPTANATGYTGVFMGCDNLFVRLSLAREPSTGAKGYTPGLSLKCLRDGVPSANLFAMYSLQGQDSWNFFKHDLTNHVPDLGKDADSSLQALRGVFAKASSYPVMIGLTNFAQYDQKGTLYSTPRFPFRLIFHPVTSIHTAFPDTPQQPFEQFLAQGLSKPGPLYEVYAEVQPDDPQNKYAHIGTISTVGPATTSNFGDQSMFYQHTRMEDDFNTVPQWKAPADAIMQRQQNVDYFTFNDLPWN